MKHRVSKNQFGRQWLWAFMMGAAGGLAAGCSADESLSARASGGSGFSPSAPTAISGPDLLGPGNGASASGGAASAPMLPPEKEVPIDSERPHAGDRFVYVPNPQSDNVAVIDADTLAIRTVEVGDEPRYLETLGGKDVAIVLNVLSDDAHILRTDATGTTSPHRLEVLSGSNAIAVAPDGKHAITYFDAARGIGGRTGSFQDVNLITIGADAGADASVGLSVGFRPSRVFFNQASTEAYVVTEDGVSIVNFAVLEKGGIPKTVAVAPREQAKVLDVSVTPDGQFALGRVPGESSIRLVELATGAIKILDLKDIIHQDPISGAAGSASMAGAAGMAGVGNVGGGSNTPPPALDLSDLDLAASGEFAIAVVRNLSMVVRIPVPGGFAVPNTATTLPITGEAIGSVVLAPDGKKALLYTTAQAGVERVTTLDLVSNQFSVQDLRKSTQAVAISGDGKVALVVHDKVAGDPAEPGIDQDVMIDRSYGYSLIQLDKGFAKLQLTQTNVGPFSITPDSSALFLLFKATGVAEIQRVGLDNFSVTRISVGSPPLSLGAVPRTQKVFVGQEHPDGRITFVDFAGKNVESVTGFEKNSRIRE